MGKIGHASLGEDGKARNGKAGDQTGKEVCVRDFYVYKGGWDTMLRPLDPNIAEKSAQACEAGCANNNIGYDMNQRNTLHTEAKKVGYNLAAVSVPVETDCSAFMTTCALAAGVTGLEYTKNAPTTSTMVRQFTQTGKYQAFTDKRYLTSDEYLKRGDIIVKQGHHTVMVLTNGAKAGIAAGEKSTHDIALEVIDGKWSSGDRRKQLLEAAGYSYTAVQSEVNVILRKK